MKLVISLIIISLSPHEVFPCTSSSSWWWWDTDDVTDCVPNDNAAQANPCNSCTCKPPDCSCFGTSPPQNMEVKNVPQMIMITFDDAVRLVDYQNIYTKLFDNQSLVNPNGCPIRATFFLWHMYTDYHIAQTLYSQGHEFATHSITHQPPPQYFRNATEEIWKEEMVDLKKTMELLAHIGSIRGARAPFLQTSGNPYYELLARSHYTWDSSLPVRHTVSPPAWPFTFHFPLPSEELEVCPIPPCPNTTIKGLWEIPLVTIEGLHGELCLLLDDCDVPTSEEEASRLLHKIFNEHYLTNRAPLLFSFHAYKWFDTEANIRAMTNFLYEVLQKGDVYVLTVSEVVEWMRAPLSPPSWTCSDLPSPPCSSPTRCEYNKPNPWYQDTRYSFNTCLRPGTECPPHYPWPGNPLGQ